jgi:hypothetical protein
MMFNHQDDIKSYTYDSEQKVITDMIQQGKNISVNAVFGSGKTSTIINSVRKLRDKTCILLTYNTHLKNEVKEKVSKTPQTACLCSRVVLEVYTYHSLSMRYFGCGKDDEELLSNYDKSPVIPIPKIDILFIDEIQDMTLLLYSFVKKFLYYLSFTPQIVICGDHLQGVYQFKGSDKRFLTLGSRIFGVQFTECKMTTSYRLTDPMGWFINECIYGRRILDTKKQGEPVTLVHQNLFSSVQTVVDFLKNRVKEKNIHPEDIFILSPSLRCSKNAPLKKLENAIFEQLNFPIYYSTMEERELNDEIIRGKVVFSTFHQSKGRERRIVVVFGFDESYYDFFAKDESKNECPSTLIVALSRAKDELVIVKDINKRPLPFIKKPIFEMTKYPSQIRIIGKVCDVEITKRPSPERTSHRKISVSDLVKFLKIEYQDVISSLKSKLFVKKTDIIDEVKYNPLWVNGKNKEMEDISDLVGILIPTIFEEYQTGINRIKTKIMEVQTSQFRSNFMREKIAKVNFEVSTALGAFSDPAAIYSSFLYMVKIYKSIESGLYSVFQITEDNWISENDIQRIIDNIRYHIKDEQLFEYDLNEEDNHPFFYHHPEFGKIYVNGRIDCLDKNHVWEFKCVKELTLEHFLQVVCYQWIWNKKFKNTFHERTFRLLNIRTGEMYEMIDDDRIVDDIVHLLFMNRYSKMESISDKDFVSSCISISYPPTKL